jgi:hypothetical protein
VCCVTGGVYDELITRVEESYRLYVYVCVSGVCVIVCDLGTSTLRLPTLELQCWSDEKKLEINKKMKRWI